MSSRMIVAALLISLPASLFAQSLGELAAREKKRREALRKSGKSAKSITEEDLNPDRVAWTGWNRFAAREDKFSVYLPAYPDSEKDTERYNFGIVRRTVYTAMVDQSTYAVVVSDLPDAAQGTPPELIFDELDKGLGRESGARQHSKKSTKLGSYPGRESTFSKTGAVLQARYFLSEDRMFVVMALAPSRDQINSSFLDSFQILE